LTIVPAHATGAGAGRDPWGQLTDEAAGVVWNWPAPAPVGTYQVRHRETAVFAQAVVVPSEESDLQCLPASVLTGRWAAGQAVHFQSAAGELTQRADIWKWFAVFCVLCLLGEVIALLGFRT
jgi:hypothetical protein